MQNDSFTVYSNTFAVQVSRHLAAAIKLMSQKLFIDEPHEFQILSPQGSKDYINNDGILNNSNINIYFQD